MINEGEAAGQRELILRMVMAWAAKHTTPPSEEELQAVVMGLVPTFGFDLSDTDVRDLLDEISRVFAIRMNMGVVIAAEGYRPWLEGRREDIDWVLWNAYSQHLLNEGRSPLVVDKLNKTLDVVLDRLGDPADHGSWERRGLVIGDVQSGKTGTYIGLMDKAADAGYRIFIVLTGNTESLRQQTQSRIDEGMLGQDSKPLSKVKTQIANKPAAIGVGLLADFKSAVASMTTMTTDFRKAGLEALNFRPGPDTLMVFVTKKNATVLRNIGQWLARQTKTNGKIQVPLLFLDDEADFASVNTNNPDVDPTAINKAIRNILSQFARSSYVGFTATPFANIFINDEDPEDLFPKDFIYALEAPTNYVGPASLFGNENDAVEENVVRIIEDAQDSFPLGHLNGHNVPTLPDSLIEAIRVFLLANALRDLKGADRAPRSMLINVSRFNAVQHQLGDLVAAELARYRNAVRMHSSAYAAGAPNIELSELQSTFEIEYAREAEWADVLDVLGAAIADIEVRVMNAKRDKEYEERQLRAENPPRTIAIGGDLLSRGLTLDGLMTSYFYRRVAASDTLMQMGRWFGYRDNYEELTRVWTTEELVADYASTADSLEELRTELVRMKDQGLTPSHYGLAVKNHPTALLITARNKMRAAAAGQKAAISLRGRRIETSKVVSDRAQISANFEALDTLITKLSDEQPDAEQSLGRAARRAWRGVPKEYVSAFLAAYEAPLTLPHFSGPLADFVRNAPAEDLQRWDVLLMGGTGSEINLGGSMIRRAKRSVGHGDGIYTISGSKRRVAGSGDVAILMSEERKDQATTHFKALTTEPTKGVPDTAYVPFLERPLLILYPIEATLLDGMDGRPQQDVPLGETLVGVLVAVPERIGPEGPRPPSVDRSADVTYMLNAPAQRLWAAEYGDEDDD